MDQTPIFIAVTIFLTVFLTFTYLLTSNEPPRTIKESHTIEGAGKIEIEKCPKRGYILGEKFTAQSPQGLPYISGATSTNLKRDKLDVCPKCKKKIKC